GAGRKRRVTRVGLQLWTVRDDCERDLHGTLRSVGGMGYDGVELFGLHGHDAAKVREWLDGAALAAVGRHAGLAELETRLPELVDELGTLGCDRLAVSWIEPPESDAAAHAVVERIADVARQSRALGIRLGFHNHWSELEARSDGDTILDK